MTEPNQQQSQEQQWAEQEFALAELGNTKRTNRLVLMAAQMARSPGGHITTVFTDDNERAAAYSFVENNLIIPQDISDASAIACARRAKGLAFVYLSIDQSSLSITDKKRQKRLGLVGTRAKPASGLQVLTSLCSDPEGTPLGLVGQFFWTHSYQAPARPARAGEPTETLYWQQQMQQSVDVLGEHAPKAMPWFQVDRAGDAWTLLKWAVLQRCFVTIRARWDRLVAGEAEDGLNGAPAQRLWERLMQHQVMGHYALEVTETDKRQKRMASISVRACPVELMPPGAQPGESIRMWAVLALEEGTCPPTEEPIEWLLLTTYMADTMERAERVIQGYAQRWRIEEFHRAWKSGACQMEQTQLGDRETIERWARIQSAVAVRIVRLVYLARTRPELPAVTEFSEAEVVGLQMVEQIRKPPPEPRQVRKPPPEPRQVRKPPPEPRQVHKPPPEPRPATMTIGEAVLTVAKLGGYTGKSSGGPPGPQVLARGLGKLELLAAFIQSLFDSADGGAQLLQSLLLLLPSYVQKEH